MGWQDDAVVSANPSWQSDAIVSASDGPSWMSQVGRQIGLTARAGITGLANATFGPAIGSALGMDTSGALQRNLTRIGLPEPQNGGERIAQDVAGAIAGQGGIGAIARAPSILGTLPAFQSPVARELAQTASSNMGSQIAVAGGSAGGAGTAREAGAGPVGQTIAGTVGGLIAGGLTSPKSQNTELAAQNETRDAVLKAGRKAKYVVPPSTVNPTFIKQQLEGMAGKADLQQAGSIENQTITNTLGREALGLAPTAQVTEKTLQNIRNRAGQAYQAVKDFGQPLKIDPQFKTDVENFTQDISAAAREFPDIVNDKAITLVQKSLTETTPPKFELKPGQTKMSAADYRDMLASQANGGTVPRKTVSPTAAVELVRKLRDDASNNYKAIGDPAKAALADVQRAAANALDGLIERNLKSTGNGELASNYINARTLIAKAHDVESALQPDGNISAQTLVRIGKNGYLDGPLKTIADFAGTFPKATQNVAAMGSPNVHAMRPYMSIMGAGVGSLIGGPVGAGVGAAVPLVLPPVMRSAMLSNPVQNSIANTNYGTGGILSRGMNSALANPIPMSQGILSEILQRRQ